MFSLITGPGVLGTQPTVVYLCPLTSCAAAWARAPQPPGRPSGILRPAHTFSSCPHQALVWVWTLWKHTDTALLPVQSPRMGLVCSSWTTSSLTPSVRESLQTHLLLSRCSQWAPTTHHYLSGHVARGQWSMSPPTCTTTCLPFLFDLSTGRSELTWSNSPQYLCLWCCAVTFGPSCQEWHRCVWACQEER